MFNCPKHSTAPAKRAVIQPHDVNADQLSTVGWERLSQLVGKENFVSEFLPKLADFFNEDELFDFSMAYVEVDDLAGLEGSIKNVCSITAVKAHELAAFIFQFKKL